MSTLPIHDYMHKTIGDYIEDCRHNKSHGRHIVSRGDYYGHAIVFYAMDLDDASNVVNMHRARP